MSLFQWKNDLKTPGVTFVKKRLRKKKRREFVMVVEGFVEKKLDVLNFLLGYFYHINILEFSFWFVILYNYFHSYIHSEIFFFSVYNGFRMNMMFLFIFVFHYYVINFNSI